MWLLVFDTHTHTQCCCSDFTTYYSFQYLSQNLFTVFFHRLCFSVVVTHDVFRHSHICCICHKLVYFHTLPHYVFRFGHKLVFRLCHKLVVQTLPQAICRCCQCICIIFVFRRCHKLHFVSDIVTHNVCFQMLSHTMCFQTLSQTMLFFSTLSQTLFSYIITSYVFIRCHKLVFKH